MIDGCGNNYSKNILVTWNLKRSNKKLYLNHFKTSQKNLDGLTFDLLNDQLKNTIAYNS